MKIPEKFLMGMRMRKDMSLLEAIPLFALQQY